MRRNRCRRTTRLQVLATVLLAASFPSPGRQREAPASALASASGSQAWARETPAKPAADQKPRTDRFGDPLPAEAIARLGTVRFRHGSWIHSMAFTPDGKQLVSHSPWHGVRVWDTATGKELRNLLDNGIASVGLTPDGNFLVACELVQNRPVIRLRRWVDLTADREFPVEDFNSSQVSPDGKVLALATRQQGEIQLWDISRGRKLYSWRAYEGHIWCLTFSDDSKILITGGSDKTIRLWDVATGQKKHEIITPSIVRNVALSGDGKLLISLGMTEVKNGASSAFYPEDTIRIWQVASGKEMRQLVNPTKEGPRTQPKWFYALAVAPDGKTLVTLAKDGVLRFWELATGKESRGFGLGLEMAGTLAFSPDNKTLAVAGSAIRLIDLASGKQKVRLPGHEFVVSSVAFARDGRTVVTASYDQAILLWDPLTGQERGRLEGTVGYGGAFAIIDNGRSLLAGGPDSTFRMWDLATGKESRRFEAPAGHPAVLAVSPDGKVLALAGADRVVVLVDTASRKELHQLKQHNEEVSGAAFAPDGRTLTVWCGDHTAHIWDLATGQKLSRFAFAEKSATGLGPPILAGGWMFHAYVAAVSPDGRHMAYGGPSRSLSLHELPTGRVVRRIDNLPDDLAMLAYSPDGKTLAWVGMHHAVVYLVEVATGGEQHRLSGHQGVINSLAFSADGQSLVSGSQDTTALVWDLTGKLGAKEKWGGPLSGRDLESCGVNLAGADAARAYQAMRRLAASPTDAISYLRRGVQPVSFVDHKRLSHLIADLDSDQFTVREAAQKELERLGEQVVPACRKALPGNPSAEARRRLLTLLEKQTQEELNPSPERLRALRAVETLERIGTPEARDLLAALALGAPDARLTVEAKASLQRLNKRHGDR